MVVVCTECLFLRRKLLARAVRKAVISSALMSAIGEPSAPSRVSDPTGDVDSELAIDCGGWKVPVLDVDSEDIDGRGECDRATEVSDILLRLEVVESTGLFNVTTLNPRPVLALAGMNRVVFPSFRFSAVRMG